MERRTLAALAILLPLAALASLSDARFVRNLPEQVSLLPASSLDGPSVLHAVDDVAPAVKNATALALAKAQYILTRYSDTLRILSIPAGLVVTFLGHFLLTPVLFIAGFLSGGGASFIAAKAAVGADTPAAAWVSIAAMAVGGTVVALLTLRLMSVGMFAMGGMLGVMLASALTPSVLGRVYPSKADVGFYAGAVVLGLIFGVLALRFQRYMVIAATAYGGAFAFFFGIGYFAGHFPTGADLSKAEKGHFGGWFVMYCAMTLLFGSVGVFAQFRLAGRRPLVHAGRVEGSRGRFGSWFSKRDDGWRNSREEIENLPRNELFDDSDSSERSRFGRFANSASKNEINDLEIEVERRGSAKEMGKRNIALSKSLPPTSIDSENEAWGARDDLSLQLGRTGSQDNRFT